MIRLEAALRARRDGGAKLLVPYMTGGLGDDWLDVVRAVAHAGADAIEIGIPFSDPVMDGPVIQEASTAALAQGATPATVLDGVTQLDIGIPVAVMTYYNLVARAGHERFARDLVAAGISAAILPDLPLEEVGPWAEVADVEGVETVLLAAPNAPDERLPRICQRARGFVYAVALLGVTGERSDLALSAKLLAARLKAVTDRPVLIGVGVSTPAQAAEACEVADGVVVGSGLVRRVLEGEGPEGAAAFVASFRKGIDGR